MTFGISNKKIQQALKNVVLFLGHNKFSLLMLVFLCVIADVLILQNRSDLRTFTILTLYIFSVRFYKLQSKIAFLFSFIFLLVLFIYFVLVRTSDTMEKAAVWAFLFLGIGIFHQWLELRRKYEGNRK